MIVAPAIETAGCAPGDAACDILTALVVASRAAGGALSSASGALATRTPTARGARRDFELGPHYRLTLVDAAEAPTADALRLAELALHAVDEQKALRGKIARLEAQAGATLEITRAICNVPILDELLSLVSERCRDLLGCEVVGFALLEEHAPTIVWRAMSGCRTETYRRVTYQDCAGVAGRAITSGRPVVVHDFLTDGGIDPGEFPISFAEGLRSVLGVPLEIDKRSRGCLMIGYRSVHDFTSEEIDTLTNFSLQAAIAVENAQLYEGIRREQARLESVVQSINEGLVLVDLADRVAYANRQTWGLFRMTAGALRDISCEELFARLAEQTADPTQTKIELSQLKESLAEFPSVDLELRDAPCNLRLTHFNVYDPSGDCLGRGYLCRDITFEKQVDAMKTDVISLVSHEIKTPLASIRGYASALLDDSRNRTRALEVDYLRMIDTESARLDDLVCNLTDVSKLDAGVLFLEKHEMSPAYLVRSVVGRWRKANPQRRFRVICDEHIAPIQIDRRRIAQVLDNVLSNAVKNSPAASVVVIALAEEPQTVVFSVTDRGVGISRTHRERVFDRFYRVQARRQEGDGSGLGLFISRGIVVAHGGDISLESRIGEGTTVTFSLPKEAAPMG
ncbi:MAG: hypothetical protein NVSMB5_00960 [Candidatus Velthaea sp.]